MKKFAIILAGLMFTGIASAADKALDSGNNAIILTDCSLLANDITIGLTSNVTGYMSCDDVTKNHVAISLCHTKGLTSTRSAVVTTVDGVATCTISSTENCVQSTGGAVFPSVTTEDGTVRQEYPGDNCTQANTLTRAQALITAIP